MKYLDMVEVNATYAQLKESATFNTVMFHHYQKRYYKARRSWNFVLATMLWLRMAQYEMAMMKAQINVLKNQLCLN